MENPKTTDAKAVMTPVFTTAVKRGPVAAANTARLLHRENDSMTTSPM